MKKKMGSLLLSICLVTALLPTVAFAEGVSPLNTVTAGDYTAVDEAIAAIPPDLSLYTPASVQKVRDAVAAVNRELQDDEQSEIDGMAAAIRDAIGALEEDTAGEAQGCFRMSAATENLYITKTGYRWGDNSAETEYAGPYRLSGISDRYRVIVESGTHEITFFELDLTTGADEDASPVTIRGNASVNITLEGENRLENTMEEEFSDCAALNVTTDAALKITDQSTGNLRVVGQYGAGIGGSLGEGTGSIVICGGTVTAQSEGAAAIGSGLEGRNAKEITISGGTVIAESTQSGGAGIGGGDHGDSHITIIISGGSVSAEGGSQGAGIGSGHRNISRSDTIIGDVNVTITGGSVSAEGGSQAAGIGNGVLSNYSSDEITASADITITGGRVKAQADSESQSIGALSAEPDLSGYASYKWRTDEAGRYTVGHFVWNDDPCDAYVEIIPYVKSSGGGSASTDVPKVEVTDQEKVEITFTDVSEASYYYDAVRWAVEHGITSGTSDGTTFSPNDACTRAQAITFLWHAVGSPEPETECSFTDVPADSYYAKAVQWAVEHGITQGTGDTTFGPDAICSRGQIVTFLWRSQNSTAASDENPFDDVKAGAYYEDAVRWAVGNGVTSGTSDTTFNSAGDCTRAQIVTFLWKVLAEQSR
ncbi:MAG: S-layer homology domain-containing protein [Firmicutes bacterium]|nr:S-layer homology domain-containing protein [Bacillota bacterium]